MGRYILSRLIQSIPVLILVSVISFGLMKLVPGDPAILIGGPFSTPAELDNIRKNLGLDQPFHVQMWRYYAGLARGDLGTSLLLGKPVLQATLERVMRASRPTCSKASEMAGMVAVLNHPTKSVCHGT